MVLVHDLVQQREPSSAEIIKPALCWPSHVQVPYFSRSLLIRAQRNGTHIPEQLSRLQLSRRMRVALDLVHCRKRAQTAHESGTPCCDLALHLTHPHRPTRCTGDPVGICPANPEVHALSPGHDLSSTRRPTTRYCGLVQPRETRYVLPGGTNQSHRLSSLGGHILTKNPRPKTQLMGFPPY